MGGGEGGWGKGRNVKRRSRDGGKEVIEERGRVGGMDVTEEEREVGGGGGLEQEERYDDGRGGWLGKATMVSYSHETIISG